MSIVELDGPPSWPPDASETGKNTKRLWIQVEVGTTLLTPPPVPMGILYSPQFRSHRPRKK